MGRRICTPGWRVVRQYLRRVSFHYVLKGAGYFRKGGVTHRVGKGDLFICLPGEPATYWADMEDPYDCAWISFQPTEEVLPYLTQPVVRLPGAARIFELLAQGKENTEHSWLVYGSLYQLLSMIAQESNTQRVRRDYLQETLDHIERYYPEDIQVGQLAQRAGLDRSYFTRIFQRHMGLSPQAYLVAYRLEQAEHLLLSTNLTQKEIGRQVGYQDVSLFSRMFKRKSGISPGQYRKNATYSTPLEEE